MKHLFQKGVCYAKKGAKRGLTLYETEVMHIRVSKSVRDISKLSGLRPSEIFTAGVMAISKGLCPLCQRELPGSVQDRLADAFAENTRLFHDEPGE